MTANYPREMRQERPWLEVNRNVPQLGVAVPEGVENVGLRAYEQHETDNSFILPHCSNAFHMVKRTAVLAKVATCVPALTHIFSSASVRD